MSDTARAEPQAPPRSRWKGRCCLVLLVVLVAVAAFAVRTHHRLQAPAPLAFEPFRWRPLEESLLTAQFEGRALGQSLLGGGSAEVSLTERELNALVFGRGIDQTPDRKARLLIRGGHLRLESSTPRQGGEGYWNIALDFTLAIGPQGLADLQVHGGEVGEYGLDPVSRWLLVRTVRQALTETLASDDRLRRIRALSVEGDRVRLTWDPQR